MLGDRARNPREDARTAFKVFDGSPQEELPFYRKYVGLGGILKKSIIYPLMQLTWAFAQHTSKADKQPIFAKLHRAKFMVKISHDHKFTILYISYSA